MAGAMMTSATIVYPNKSRIIAVPGKPETVRGYCAHLWADEFGFFDDPDATWRAIFPTLSNPIRGLKRALITSTANGKSGRGARFYKMCTDPKVWAVYKTTILDAAPELGTNVEELRAAIDDESAWAQEFMCEFLDSSNCLLPYDIIALAESADATVYADPAIFAPESKAELYMGIDFGRINDPTVAWTFEKVGDVLVTREVLVLRNTSTPDQQRALDHRIAKARRVCLDYTGPGIGLGDYLAQDHGEYAPTKHRFGKMELCTFTVNFKREIFPKLRRAFEAPVKVRVPIDVECREDLHEMQQIVRNGEYSYEARRTKEGHSDRCTALALALRAGSGPRGPTFMPKPFKLNRRNSRIMIRNIFKPRTRPIAETPPKRPPWRPTVLGKAKTANGDDLLDSWLTATNPLTGLSITSAQSLFDCARRGDTRQLHWLYNEMEAAMPVLMVCAERRSAALSNIDWQIHTRKPTRARGWDKNLAAEQSACLEQAFGDAEVTNLSDAVEHLSQAFFRGFAHISPTVDGR